MYTSAPANVRPPWPPPHRLWSLPDPTRLILAAVEPADHRALRRVSRALREQVDTPAMWARRYAPSRIHFSTRTVHTAIACAVRRGASDTSVHWLGYSDGHLWRLQGGYVPPLPGGPLDLLRLQWARVQQLALIRLRLPVVSSYEESQEIAAPELKEELERQLAYQLVLERGYRRHLGAAPSDRLHRRVFSFWGQAALIIVASTAEMHLFRWADSLAIEIAVMPIMAFTLYRWAKLLDSFAATNAAEVTELVVGPRRYRTLNKHADHYYWQAVRSNRPFVAELAATPSGFLCIPSLPSARAG